MADVMDTTVEEVKAVTSVPPPDSTGAEYSKEYVQKLMEENAGLRKRTSVQDQRDRDVIKAAQPGMAEYIKTLTDHYPDHQREIGQIGSWAGTVHETARPDNEMALVRFVECASARDKRAHENSAAGKENETALRDVMKDRDSLKEETTAKTRRIAELEELCNTRQTDNEALIERLAGSDALGKYAFSERNKREAVVNGAEPANPSSGLVAVTSNASGKKPMKAADPLLSFLNNTSGGGDGLLKPSFGSTHETIGAPASQGGFSGMFVR